jgi:hypothetical protein
VFKVTFANEPERNGESVFYPKFRAACLRTLAELLAVAAGRGMPQTIAVVVAGGRGNGRREGEDQP